MSNIITPQSHVGNGLAQCLILLLMQEQHCCFFIHKVRYVSKGKKQGHPLWRIVLLTSLTTMGEEWQAGTTGDYSPLALTHISSRPWPEKRRMVKKIQTQREKKKYWNSDFLPLL